MPLEIYTFEDRNGDSLTLRPEGTACCVRACEQRDLLFNQNRWLWRNPTGRSNLTQTVQSEPAAAGFIQLIANPRPRAVDAQRRSRNKNQTLPAEFETAHRSH